MHTGSTRHQEEQYYEAAIALKNEILQRFPICKVYLKPLIYDQLDHTLDTMFLQRRLGSLFNLWVILSKGCFEVQVLSR